MQTKTENYTGVSCTGISGGSNRVLTLSNTGTTEQNGFQVHVSGLALSLTSEYTVSHNSASTEITFLTPLWDDVNIIVQYLQNPDSTGVSVSGDDFSNGPLSDFGVVAVRTPVTMEPDYSGNKAFTDGVDEDINIVIMPYNKKHNLDQAGLTKAWDATGYIASTSTLNKYDKITYDSKVYRVDSVSTRDFNGTTIMQKAILYFTDDE